MTSREATQQILSLLGQYHTDWNYEHIIKIIEQVDKQ